MFACKGKGLDNLYGNNDYICMHTPQKIQLHMHFGLLAGFCKLSHLVSNFESWRSSFEVLNSMSLLFFVFEQSHMSSQVC